MNTCPMNICCRHASCMQPPAPVPLLQESPVSCTCGAQPRVPGSSHTPPACPQDLRHRVMERCIHLQLLSGIRLNTELCLLHSPFNDFQSTTSSSLRRTHKTPECKHPWRLCSEQPLGSLSDDTHSSWSIAPSQGAEYFVTATNAYFYNVCLVCLSVISKQGFLSGKGLSSRPTKQSVECRALG